MIVIHKYIYILLLNFPVTFQFLLGFRSIGGSWEGHQEFSLLVSEMQQVFFPCTRKHGDHLEHMGSVDPLQHFPCCKLNVAKNNLFHISPFMG